MVVPLKPNSGGEIKRPEDPVWLSLAPDLTLTLGNQPLSGADLQAGLDAQTKARRDVQVFLRADRVVPYGDLMAVLDQLRAAGYLKVALVGLQSTAEPQATP